MNRRLRRLRIGVLSASLFFTGFGYAQTYTFTTGGATGNVGPTQADINTAYSGTSLDGAVTVVGGIQYWEVPNTGVYIIEGYGGQGYGDFGGRGAHMVGEFNLTAGDTLKILVGQKAGHYLNYPSTTYNHQFGGGGGSFITYTDNTPLLVAGGGGGNHEAQYLTACDGQITEAGSAGAQGSTIGAGGTGGNGGLQASSADAGGGLLTNGTGTAAGQAFINGGLGGIDEGTGGFGCGGGTSSWNNYRGGGGGGYSGGGGGNNGGSCCAAGGGGGSYNAGTNQVNTAGVQLGDGLVVITLACDPNPGSLVADAATLPDVTEACVVTSLVAPTASNSCISGIEGTPSISLPFNTVGTTTITWTFTDGVNTITQNQDIVINGIDNDPPVINNPNLLSYSSQCSFTPPTPTASDVCAGTVYGTPDVAFPITTQGQTTITWTYDDGSGNTVTQTQTITIEDVAAPIPDMSTLEPYQGCNSATPPAPTATDNCLGQIAGTPDVSFPITTPGTTTVTWTYDDGHGNMSSQTQDVVITSFDGGATLSGTTITANQSGATYQWIDCSTMQPIFGQTASFYNPPVTGDYAVEVTYGNCVDTSACYTVDYTGIEELNSDLVKIYPNPTTSGEFHVDFEGTIDQIVVVDALGRAIALPTDLATGTVNGSGLATGRYTVKVFTSDAVYTKGLVILD